jgi:hypothetical protein
MSDPLSVTANVFAVVGFSLQSCVYVLRFFERISDAPSEVEHNMVWLRALHATFSELQEIGNDVRLQDAQVELPSGFNARLEGCRADLLEVESRIYRIGQKLKAGRLLQTWARVKYSLSSEEWLAKFSRRLQTYHTTFALDLMTIQM